jgi:polysaccharide biosynthesis/export protein
MRTTWVLFFVILFTAGGVAASPAQPEAPQPAAVDTGNAYLIGAGDLLGFGVGKDTTLTRTVVVLSDGKITLPLIGEVAAGGRTVAQVKKEIEERLSSFVPEPVLTLEVKQCNSLYIFVMGRVNNPGRSNLVSTVNVLQALAMAGGPNPFAKRGQIKIFRSEGGNTRILPFDYDEVTAGRRLEENVELVRGDVIFVP